MLNKRIVVTRYGGTEVLNILEEPLRAPRRGEVRVRVQSAGVALSDVMRREGKLPSAPTPPFTPGYDAVGIVDAVGDGVDGYTQGQSVAVFFNGTGGYAAYVYAQVDELLPVPAHIDPGVMVAAVLNYLSAYQLLHRIAKVSEGDRVLIHGASGGVGTALLDLGRLAKLEMYGTASLAKHSVLSQYGATPIDYRSDDFVDFLNRHSPGGMDAVFDPIGGDNYQRSMQTLSQNGRIVAYGYTSVLDGGSTDDWARDWEKLSTLRTTEGGHSVFVYSITALKRERLDWFRADSQAVFSLLEEGKIRPLISDHIPLKNAASAQAILENSLAMGKVVLMNDF